MIQLDGGNDGLNTVVPYGDEAYARNRKTLKLAKDSLIKVSDGIGLHQAMGQAGKLLESGRLGIVPGVGYPNPNRSHFASMAIWHTAAPRRGRARRPGLAGAKSRRDSGCLVAVCRCRLDPGRDPRPAQPGVEP